MIGKKVTILISGGVDSTGLINYYSDLKYSIQALHISFNQASQILEKKAVKKICNHYGIKCIFVNVTNKKTVFGAGNIIGRNLFLISIALMYSNVKNGLISIGIHTGTSYIDCSENFLKMVNELCFLYTSGKVVIDAPFIKFSKLDIFKYCNSEKIPLHLTYSCEVGQYPPCGTCGSCKELNKLYVRKNE